MIINKLNLYRIIEKLKTLRPHQFNMVDFIDKESSYEEVVACGTVGCVLGHSVSLDTKLLKRIYEAHHVDNSLNSAVRDWRMNGVYTQWGVEFTGIDHTHWLFSWCFNGLWADKPEYNTIEHAISRIKAVIDDKVQQHQAYSFFITTRTA